MVVQKTVKARYLVARDLIGLSPHIREFITRLRQDGIPANGIFIYNILFEGALDAAKTEIAPPANTLDGTATAATIKITGLSDDDKPAGAGLRVARVLGITAAGAIGWEDIDMPGNGTSILTTSFQRLFHAHGIQWGANGTNTGKITITNSTGATIYLTIEATKNESDCSQIWIPDGFYGIIAEMSLNFTSIGQALGYGANLGYNITGNLIGNESDEGGYYATPPVQKELYFNTSANGKKVKFPEPVEVVGSDTASIYFYENYLTVTEGANIGITAIIWQK